MDNSKTKGHCHGHDHCHGGESGNARTFIAPAISFAMLVVGMLMSHFGVEWFVSDRWVRLAWYIAAFIPVGLPVVKESVEGIVRGDIFNEFTLMFIACIGAFCIWELPEAVGVMLFYSIGEKLQDMAVDRATRNISRLVDVRGAKANLIRDGKTVEVDPKSVNIGDIVEVRPGERAPLDGVMLSDSGLFDTSALTGESVPREIDKGGEVLAGMISSQSNVRMRVTRRYENSALSRILDMVGRLRRARPMPSCSYASLQGSILR